MAINLNDTLTVLRAVEQIPTDNSFLYDLLVSGKETVEDEKGIWDYMKGSRKMAPVVHAGTGGVILPRDGFETREIGFTTIAPERIVENENLRGRMFGENIFGAMTPAERAKKMFARDIKEMKDAIQRRKAWMVRQIALTGKMEVFEYTENGRSKHATKYADFQFTNNVTIQTKWNQSGATISRDMMDMTDIVTEGGGAVEVILMDKYAAGAMLENTDYIKNTFDNRNVDMGMIRVKYKGDGVRFLGWSPDGIEMYSVVGSFEDDDGVTKPILPRGTVIATGRGVLSEFVGPVTQVEEYGPNATPKTYVKDFVPLRYGDIGANSVSQRLTSRPVFVPRNVDAWAIANVL